VISAENAADLVPLAGLSFAAWELVTAVAWSPDGQSLAVAVGERVALYQSRDLQQLASFETGAFSHGLAFSPDGAWLAAGSRDGWLRAWFVHALLQPGATISGPDLAIQAHKKGVNTLAFSPDGSLLASGGK
jgi:WD40 repeat protein